MVKAGAKPSRVYEAVKNENGTLTATRKDISNLIAILNFVGISNLGINCLQTFGIAGAWISGESEKTYSWIIEQLASLIFSDIFPLDDSFDKVIYLDRMMIAKEKWVVVYTSRIMHFGAMTTQHVEGFLDEQQKSALLGKHNEILEIPVTDLSKIKVPEKLTIYNPKSDGNCGFRSLAVAIRGKEKNWTLVQLAMNVSPRSREPSKITVPILWSESNFDNPNINFGTEMSKITNYSTKSAKTVIQI
ncbi:hypothetical protein C2G38_2183489 [Gigaspora rosea]|uniref:OTU domain-containing protein n=1 Tax=Gigaspora rosea TaxID=44941 RepID=A0A397VG43_9GLOM|nr:hypothetical protein C2G38_2183489 [Gigaspora rosea]